MSRVRVALVNDYHLVVHGLEQMLAPYDDRVEVVELDVRTDVDRSVDVALYDTFSNTQADGEGVDALLADRSVGAVAIFTWNMQEPLVARAREKGVQGYLSKSLSADELVEALEKIAAGGVLVCPASDIGLETVDVTMAEWPGRTHGLSPRQAEVLALVTQGLSNDEISKRAYLSVNTVKSYLRQAYHAIGVDSRTQAILWGIDHGLGLPPRDSESADG